MARSLAALQGGSYLYFGVWSLLGRSHYRRVHRLRGAPWLLNAHGLWLILAGSLLTFASAKKRTDQPEVRLIGLGSSGGLAVVDAATALTSGVARIYYADMAFEAGLAVCWVLLGREAAA